MPHKTSNQLLLPLEKSGLLRFSDFCPTENTMAFALLQNWPANSKMIYLKGHEGSGKTHLSEALAQSVIAKKKEVLMISGKTAPPIHFFYDLPHQIDYIILDDVDALLSFSPQYEEALFSLYNQVFDHPNAHLLFTSSLSVEALPLRLVDLKSRLHAMLPLRLTRPSMDTRQAILKLHAKRLQLRISEEMIDLLLAKLPPNPTKIIDALKSLAEQSLCDKKPLTPVYIKHFLKIMLQ